MKLTLSLLCCMIMMLAATGCTQERVKYVCSDGSTVNDANLCPKDANLNTGETVKCSNSGACPNGYCDMSSPEPNDWHCEKGSAPESYCGDGNCNPNGENYANCPSDCKQ